MNRKCTVHQHKNSSEQGGAAVRRQTRDRWFDSQPGRYRQLGQLSLPSLWGR